MLTDDADREYQHSACLSSALQLARHKEIEILQIKSDDTITNACSHTTTIGYLRLISASIYRGTNTNPELVQD